MKFASALVIASAVLVASVFAAYDWTKVPLTRVAPPFRVLYPSGVTPKDAYDTWFCSYLAFNPITWNFPVAATQFTGYVSLSGAKAITTVSSLFNDVASVSSKTSASATFYARIGSYQQQYTAKTDMRFFVCGSKDAAVKYSDIKWTAMLIMTTDMRPPPPPVPGWKGFTLGTTTNVTSCYPGVYPDILKWDILLSQHLVNAERARIGGKVAAGGNVFTNLLEGKIGIDYPDCAASCNGGMSDIFLMAGNYIVFNKPSPGICRGFMQGNATISTQSQLTVASGCPAITGSFPLDLTAIKTNWIAWAIFLKNKQPTAVCGYALDPLVGGTLNLVFNNKFPELIWWLPGDFLTEAGVFSINAMNPELVADAKTIIFNIAGAQVIFGLDFSYYFAEVGDRVIFNFYEATKVMFQSGTYVGTVLAPFADVSVYGGSSVYGQIFSKTLVVIGSEVRTFDKKWSGFTTYTGTCLSCAPNFYGPNCQACSCKYNEICNDGPQGDGSCRCMDNFNPTCTDCKTGFYGKFCNKTCTTTCVTRGTCSDGINGTGACLSCNEPFDGKECTNCIDTVYGPNCDKDCESVCFIRGGTCDFGVNGTGLCKNCSDPYANGPLKLCDECSNGFYGADCSLQCSETCAKNGICSSGIEGTGECLSCKPRFVGTECEECISGLWGANCTNCTRSCLLYGTCNDGASGDGSCSNCADGITGPQCNECVNAGYYGPNCDKKCSDTCIKNGKCSSGPLGTGACLSCKPRFRGKNCENAGTTAKASLAICIGLILLLLGLAY